MIKYRQFNITIAVLASLIALIFYQNCGGMGSSQSSPSSLAFTSNAQPAIWYSSLQYESDNGDVYSDCSIPSDAEMNNDNVAIKNSYGSAHSSESYLTADLGSEKLVNRIGVGGVGPGNCWGSAASYWREKAANIEIQVSPDNVNWQKVASGNQIRYSNSSVQPIYFDPQTVRYVRIYLASGWLATGSFRVGSDPDQTESLANNNDYSNVSKLPVVNITNGIDNWYSNINYSSSDGPKLYSNCEAPTEANMNDGLVNNSNRKSFGSASSGDSWLMADLGSIKPVNEILVGGGPLACWGNASGYWEDYKIAIQISSDGIKWKTVAFGSHIEYSDNELKPIYFQTTTARYIRLYVEDNWLATGQFRLGIKE